MSTREEAREAAAAREADAARIEEEAAVYEPTTILLSRIGPADAIGHNRGLVRLKRTSLDEKGREKIEMVVIPIKTEGVQDEAKNIIDGANLKPPVKTTLIHPASEMGRELGLVKAAPVDILQPEDEAYQKRLNDHNLRLQWAIAATAVDVPLEFLPPGQDKPRAATTLNERIDALRQAGFTNTQVSEISIAVNRIMAWTKQERARFFGENWG